MHIIIQIIRILVRIVIHHWIQLCIGCRSDVQNPWKEPPPFHGFFSHVRDFIIISSFIFNNHVQATLLGKPDMVQFTQGILTICLLNRLDQFFFIGRGIIVEQLYDSEKPIKNVGVRRVRRLCVHGKV